MTRSALVFFIPNHSPDRRKASSLTLSASYSSFFSLAVSFLLSRPLNRYSSPPREDCRSPSSSHFSPFHFFFLTFLPLSFQPCFIAPWFHKGSNRLFNYQSRPYFRFLSSPQGPSLLSTPCSRYPHLPNLSSPPPFPSRFVSSLTPGTMRESTPPVRGPSPATLSPPSVAILCPYPPLSSYVRL